MHPARTIATLLAAAIVTACADGATGPEATCIAVVNVDGVFYGSLSGAGTDPGRVDSAPYLEITRNTGCLDQGELADPLGHGESNFLPVGTALHRVEGFEPSERLVYRSTVLGEWLELGPID